MSRRDHSHSNMDSEEEATHMKFITSTSDLEESDVSGIQQVDLSRGRPFPGNENHQNPQTPQTPQTDLNDRPLERAERQLSYQTTETEGENLNSLPNIHPQLLQHRLITSSGREDQVNDFNFAASIKAGMPSENIPVRTLRSTNIDPLHSSDDNVGVTSNVRTTPDRRGGSHPSFSSGASSRASRSVSIRTPIKDETIVQELPLEFIDFLSTNFNRKGCRNWKNLLNLYNWNYKKISDFQHKSHPDGFFCSLLNEPEFQLYRVADLFRDLEDIPRLDTLEDLKAKIEEYNFSF